MLRIFGGRNTAQSVLSDTWTWSPSGLNGGTWTEQNRLTQPAGRAEGAVAFNSTHGSVVVGPGLSLVAGDVNDAWADVEPQSIWQPLAVASNVAPPPRRLTTWVWDDANGCFLLFGGRVNNVGASNDLWQLCPSTPVSTPTAMPTSTALSGLDMGQSVDGNGNILLPPAQVVTATAAGARYVRLNFILGSAADWNDAHLLASFDTIVDNYLAAGIQVLGLVNAQATTDGNQADWTANNAENNPGANGDNGFISTTFVQNALKPLVAHFHDRIAFWELWNEPNAYQSCSGSVCSGGSFIYPSNFAALLADSYTAIKDPSPAGLGLSDVTLISGGLFGHSIGGALTATNAGATYLTSTFTEGITTTGTWATFAANHGSHYPLDGIGQHIYIDQNLLTTMTDIAAYYSWIHGAAAAFETPQPTYLTEGAWSTTSVSQSIQAQNLDILYATSRSMGYVPRVTWFELQDVPAANLYFGLVDPSGQPKQALSNYATQSAISAAPSPPADTSTPTSLPIPTQTPKPSETSTPGGVPTTSALAVQAGWNLIALPLSPSTPLQAQSILGAIVGSNADSIAELATWQGSSWTTALNNGGALLGANFTLVPGQGYFIYSDHASSFDVTGLPVTVAPTLTLTPGWNLIGVPTASGAQMANDLLNSLTTAGLSPLEVASWTGSGWQTDVQIGLGSYTGTNFGLNPGQGYFVYVQNSGNWVAQAG